MRLWKRADPAGDGGGDVPGYVDLVPVGQGGFGVVYRARQERLGRTVAVKVLAAATVDAAALARFQRECELTGRLTGHPNVVTVLDTGMTRTGRPFVVTEYFEHGSLKQRLDDRGPLPVDEVLRIGVKIAGALAAAHEAGILHRDVKPQNILMSRYGEPALADFGVARLLDSGEVSTQGNALTLFHAAPEILEGRPPSPSSDTYALASTMYQLLSGRSPFERASDEGIGAVLGRILREDPPELPRADVPDQVKALLRAALAKSPEERFRDPLAFAETLQGLQADLGYAVTELPVSREGAAPAAPDARLSAEILADATTDPQRVHPNKGATPQLPGVSMTVLRPDRRVAAEPPPKAGSGRKLRRLGLAATAVVTAALIAVPVWAATRGEKGATGAGSPVSTSPTSSRDASPGRSAPATAQPSKSTNSTKPTAGPTGRATDRTRPVGGGRGGTSPSPPVTKKPGGTGGTTTPPSGKKACPRGQVCIWDGVGFTGRRYWYRYNQEDWNWHDGQWSAPANQDRSWFNNTSGPLVMQIYEFGGNDRGALRVPTICIRPGSSYSSATYPAGRGSGHLFQQQCHPDSTVVV